MSKLELLALDLEEDIDVYPGISDLVLPNVRKLTISGEPCNKAMDILLQVCSLLTEVELDHSSGFWTDWKPADMPPGIVAKIKTWTFQDMKCVLKVMDRFPFCLLRRFWCIAATTAIALTPREWEKLCWLRPLKQLSLSGIETQALFSKVPRNIEKLEIGVVCPSFHELGPLEPSEQHLLELSAVLQDLRSRKMNPERSEAEY